MPSESVDQVYGPDRPRDRVVAVSSPTEAAARATAGDEQPKDASGKKKATLSYTQHLRAFNELMARANKEVKGFGDQVKKTEDEVAKARTKKQKREAVRDVVNKPSAPEARPSSSEVVPLRSSGPSFGSRVDARVQSLGGRAETELGQDIKDTAHVGLGGALGGALLGPGGVILGNLLQKGLPQQAIKGTYNAGKRLFGGGEKDGVEKDVAAIKKAVIAERTDNKAARSKDEEFKSKVVDGVDEQREASKATLRELEDIEKDLKRQHPVVTGDQKKEGGIGQLIEGAFAKLGDLLKGIPGTLASLGGVLGRMLPLLGKAGLVGAAGFAGWEAGKWLDKHVITPGISKLTGGKEQGGVGGLAYDVLRGNKEEKQMKLNERRDQALAFFQRKGWTKAQASGIVSNLIRESKLDPNAVGDKGRAIGIAQWHPDRQGGFRKYSGKGLAGSSLEEQLEYVDYELRHGGKQEQLAGKLLALDTDAEKSGRDVSLFYERPGTTQEARMREADIRGKAAVDLEKHAVTPRQIEGKVASVPAPPPPAPPVAQNTGIDYDKLAAAVASAQKPAPAQQTGANIVAHSRNMPIRPDDLGLAIANTGVFA